jgi:uncharacterized protein YndB with AHSA1/START domain
MQASNAQGGSPQKPEDTVADIVHRIGIKASPEQVFGAVATLQGIAGWWTEEATGGEDEGEIFTVRFVDDGIEKGRMDFEMAERNPEGVVRWVVQAGPPEWLGTEVGFSLSRSDDQTVVVFGHRNWSDVGEFMAHCSMKWATFLLSLRDWVETGRGRPAPGDLKIDDWN